MDSRPSTLAQPPTGSHPLVSRHAACMGRFATTLRPAHAHTNAPRLINPWNGPKPAAAADNIDGHPVRPTPGEVGRGRPIAGKGTKSVGALWDLAQDTQKWVPPLIMASCVGKKSAYQKNPDVAVTLECARAIALDKLRKKLNAAATAAGAGAPPPQAFERWRFAAAVESADDASPGNDKNADPAVPCSVADGDGSALTALVADLTRAGVPSDAAREAAKATAEASRAEATNLRKLADRLATLVRAAPGETEARKSTKRDDGARLARVSVVFRKRSVELRSDKGGHFVVLSRRAYGKLAAMYRHVASAAPQSGLEALRAPPTAGAAETGEKTESVDRSVSDSESGSDSGRAEPVRDDALPSGTRVGPEREAAEASTLFAAEDAETRAGETETSAAKSDDSARRAFHARLFALLLRYKSIQGYGFQSGVGPRVFATLRDTLGVAFEAFASPLNCYHTKGFCSAFPDVDAPFGSRGDFFKICRSLRRGAAQVNPPFVSGVMTRVSEALDRALREADARDDPLSFVVFVPGWTDEKSWASFAGSRFLRNRFVVAAADHGYCDGAAHQRKASFRSSTYDTGVFALCSHRAEQTRAGKRLLAENGAAFERDVREAFAGARLSEAAAARSARETKKRGREGDGGKSAKEGGGASGKKEKKKENKAAKKRRKRREEKLKEEKKAEATNGDAAKMSER